MGLGGGGKKSSAWKSGLKERPSGKAIVQNKASQHLVRPTRPDGRDAHFVIADAYQFYLLIKSPDHLVLSYFLAVSGTPHEISQTIKEIIN